MPAKSPRIRKVQTAGGADFDDQLWPINCAIVILAGFVAGIVIATSEFDDPRLLYNGWARLVSVGVMMGLLFAGVAWLQGKMLRRVQLCVLLSLLAHLVLVVYLRDQYLALLAEREAEAQQQADDPYLENIVADLVQQDEPELQQSFEEPIETEAPKPAEPEAVQRDTDDPEVPTEVEPPDEPEIPQRQQPNPAVARRIELSVPRRADMAAGAQISRQEWRHRLQPNRPIPEEQIEPRPRQATAVPNPNIAPRQQRETQVQVDQRQTFEELSSARADQVRVNMSRRATQAEPRPDLPTTPAPTRQVSRPAEIPRTEAATPEPIKVAQRPQEAELMPSDETSAKRRADDPQAVRQASNPTPIPTAPETTAQIASRQRRSEELFQSAQAPRPRPARRPREVMLPTDVAAPRQETIMAPAPTARAEVDPARMPRPRQPNAPATRSPVRVTQPATNLPVQPAPSAVVQNPVRRAELPTQPSPQPRASRPAAVARTQQAPEIATARVERVAVAEPAAASSQPSLPTALPRTTAVSTMARRPTRVPQNQPAGRELPAMTSVAELPSAVARRRPAASQQEPAAMDAAPARPMSLARADAGVKIPSTTIATEAQPAVNPAATGGTPASRAPTASAAAVRRTGRQPTSNGSVAVSGVADFAVGSTQIVARTGQARATGAGQPSATANASARRIARATGPAVSTAASGVPTATAAASGQVASRTQGPSSPSFNIRSSAARRGGTVRELAEQTIAGSGPAGTSGASGAVEIAQTSRATRVESQAVAVAGSGTPKPGKTLGGAVAPNALAQASEPAAAAPGGGTVAEGTPLQARVSGPRREVSGLPGSLQSQPMVGAMASLTSDGAPLTGAVARRAIAAQQQPGPRDLGATRTVQMRKPGAGTDLPVAAVPVENAPKAGTGGASVVTRGALPSSLERGSSATVRRAAADVSLARATAASGATESGIGSARAVAMAGRARAVGDDVPAPTASGATPEIGRSAAVGPAIATPGPTEAEPGAEMLAGGPAAETATTGQPAAGVPESAVTQGTGAGLSAAQPAQQTGALGSPDVGAVAVARPSRATSDDAMMAAASVGAMAGPSRRMGVMQTAGTSTAAPELAEVGQPSGGVDAAPDVSVRSDLAGPQRQLAGLSGGVVDQIMVEMAMEHGSTATTPGVAAGPRRLPQGDEPGPAVAAEVGRGPLRKTDAVGLPRGVAEAVADQPIASAAPSTPGDVIDVTDGTGPGEPSRQEGGLPVQIAAVAGPGGLSYDPSPEVGLPSRRARPESEIIHTVSRRFVIERSGGELAIDGRVREQPTKAFRQRDVGRRAQAAQARGGSEGTEIAVEMGLDFFARHQFPDGHWSIHELPLGLEYEDPALGKMQADTAATGLALLTYLGAGYTHLDDKHRTVVSRGIDWLVRHQNKETGDLFSGGTNFARFYSHAIAAIALCEAYGMTKDPELREPARLAIDFLITTQHPQRGGWRYSVDQKGQATETDTSVSGWGLMALKSAQMAGLDVPDEVLAKLDSWLNTAAAKKAHGQYVYNPYADRRKDEQLEGLEPNLAMTAEAMLMRMYLGTPNDDPGLIAGAEHLKQNLPRVGTRQKSLRNCYYWYYATQAMFQMQGDYWSAWNDQFRSLAAGSQIQFGDEAGSWHPKRPVADAWDDEGGRLFVTSMHLLMLEVYYRHLPLFQELGQ